MFCGCQRSSRKGCDDDDDDNDAVYIYMVGRTGVIPYFTLSCFLRGFDGVSDTHLEKIIFMKKYLVYENRLLQISDFQEHFKW